MPQYFRNSALALLFCASTLTIPTFAQTATPPNLVLNGNFEADADGNGAPDVWDAIKAGKSWETEDGNRFYRLKALEPDKSTSIYQRVNIPEGAKAFELAWKQRVSELKIGKDKWYDARVIANFKDAAGQPVKGGPNPAYTQKDTKGWVTKSIKFLVPEGAKTIELMPILFNVAAGTFDIDDISLIQTDATVLEQQKNKAEVLAKFNNVAPEAPNKANWPTELHVEGTKVLNKEGKEVLLRGVNVPSLGWKPTGENVLRSVMVAIDDWKSNAIRLPVKEDMWFGTNSEQKDGGVAYRKLVDDAITMAANRGAYTVLDLHRFRAPKQAHVDFWKDAAAKYKGHPTVIFDVFNEPYSISWKVLRDGGFVEDKNAGPDEVTFLSEEEKQVKGFKSVGMQALVDAIRGTGAKNIIIVGGLDYSYDLSGMAQGFTIDEKQGNGMMLSTHIYSQKRDYPAKVLVMADKYPIFVGEFGANTKKFDFMPAAAQEDADTWMPKIFGFMQKHKMHYTAWSFHPSAGPVMLQGWDYAPTPEFGAVVKRALAGEQFPYAGMR